MTSIKNTVSLYPPGLNPNSHHNKGNLGNVLAKSIVLTKEQWEFVTVMGNGNRSRGGREVMRAMEIIAKKNWADTARLLNCDASTEALKDKLIEIFPGIERGKKNENDLLTEIALGEASLELTQTGYVRILNLASIAVVDKSRNRKLIESYQELSNGKRLVRNIEGVTEKMQYQESSEDVARRALKQIGITPASLEYVRKRFNKNQTSKYKGVNSWAYKHEFIASLYPKDIKEQYEERKDGDLTMLTVFNWVPV